MRTDVCLSPALWPTQPHGKATVVVTDVFRAATTIITALENGARSILPVATVEEATQWKKRGWLAGAERNVRKCAFADFGNSPADYTPDKVAGRDIVFTTTNGTRAIPCAMATNSVLIGAFANLQAVADRCAREERDVVVLCSGWEDMVCVEDTLYAGALTACLGTYDYHTGGDAARIALMLWKEARGNLAGYLERTEHVARLRANGLDEDIARCLQLNTSSLVPAVTKIGEITCR